MQFVPRKKKQQSYLTSRESAALEEKTTTQEAPDTSGRAMAAQKTNAVANNDKRNLEDSPSKKRKRGYPNTEDELRPEEAQNMTSRLGVFGHD
jgi:hypothetical protein